ncbi:MAG: hypothetical protein WCI62_00295 [Erysipelotrichaceae bacterium]
MLNKQNDENKEVSIYGIIDERTKAIVYQGDAYTGRFMVFVLFIDIGIRGLKLNVPLINSNWDLMLIVIVGGLISTAYQIKNRVILNRPFSRSFKYLVLLIGLSAVFAFTITYFLK